MQYFQWSRFGFVVVFLFSSALANAMSPSGIQRLIEINAKPREVSEMQKKGKSEVADANSLFLRAVLVSEAYAGKVSGVKNRSMGRFLKNYFEDLEDLKRFAEEWNCVEGVQKSIAGSFNVIFQELDRRVNPTKSDSTFNQQVQTLSLLAEMPMVTAEQQELVRVRVRSLKADREKRDHELRKMQERERQVPQVLPLCPYYG